MKKIKLKIKSLKYVLPIVFKTIKFRIKIWLHKKF